MYTIVAWPGPWLFSIFDKQAKGPQHFEMPHEKPLLAHLRELSAKCARLRKRTGVKNSSDMAFYLGGTPRFVTLLGEYGAGLAKRLQDNRGADNNAELLADYLQNLLCVKTYNWIHLRTLSKSYKNTTEKAKKTAFKSMQEYDDPHREGLEFIRIFMRTVLQEEARAAHALFTTGLPLKDDASVRESPIYHGLAQVISSLSSPRGREGTPHPALVSMTKNARYNGLLDDVLGALLHLCGTCDKWGTQFETIIETGDAFQRTLCSLIPQGFWLPAVSLVAHVWQQHDGLDKDAGLLAETYEVLFIKNILGHQGQYLHLGLDYLLKASHLRLSTMDAFFPLPLARCDARPTLLNMVQLLNEPSSAAWAAFQCERAAIFQELLSEHHPDVLALLDLHAAVRSGQESFEESTDTMLESFERLCRGITSMEDVVLPEFLELDTA